VVQGLYVKVIMANNLHHQFQALNHLLYLELNRRATIRPGQQFQAQRQELEF
jgi:hypothetical protein